MNENQSERYEVEVMVADEDESRSSYSDVDSAMAIFYSNIGENYSEPSYNVSVHDLVAGETLACWWYNPDDEVGKVLYNTPTPVLGN